MIIGTAHIQAEPHEVGALLVAIDHLNQNNKEDGISIQAELGPEFKEDTYQIHFHDLCNGDTSLLLNAAIQLGRFYEHQLDDPTGPIRRIQFE